MITTGDLTAAFEERIADADFSCLGARAALRRGTLICAEYDLMNDAASTTLLHRRLIAFAHDDLDAHSDFQTFAAIFRKPREQNETEFELALWSQLVQLRELDSERYPWAPEVDSDPALPQFAYSVAGHAFFVVGLHPGASRISRRFPHPALVFNSHVQFRRLKAEGTYAALQRRIRQREMRLQGSINPNLTDFGQAPESVQYSGRPNPPGWQCPVSHWQLAGPWVDSKCNGATAL